MLDVGVGIGASKTLGLVVLAGVGDGAAFFWKNPRRVFWFLDDCEGVGLGFGFGVDISLPSIPRTIL